MSGKFCLYNISYFCKEYSLTFLGYTIFSFDNKSQHGMVNLLRDSLRSLFETGDQEDVAQRSLNPKVTTIIFFMLF